MSTLLGGIGAKAQLFSRQPVRADSDRFGTIIGTARQGAGGTGSIFSTSNAVRSQRAVIGTLSESLTKATGSLASARIGAGRLGELVDRAEQIVTRIEAGAPGTSFRASFEVLEREAAAAVARGGFGGTNLLDDNGQLTVTIGAQAKGGAFEFRQLTFTTSGLAPTEGELAAAEPRVETRNVTLAERLLGRIERIESRQIRLAERQERLTARQERLEQRQATLDARTTRLEARRTRLTERLGQLAETGRLTPEREGRIRARIDRIGERIERIGGRITRIGERMTRIGERQEKTTATMTRIGERLTRVQDRLDRVTANGTGDRVVATVEREVEAPAPAPAKGFDTLITRIAERAARGDAEGARALIEAGRERLGRLDAQLDRISQGLKRQGGMFGAITAKLDAAIEREVDRALDDRAAAFAASRIMGRLAGVKRLFGEDSRPALLSLFEGRSETGAEPSRETTETGR